MPQAPGNSDQQMLSLEMNYGSGMTAGEGYETGKTRASGK
jgi:hypothetical protein